MRLSEDPDPYVASVANRSTTASPHDGGQREKDPGKREERTQHAQTLKEGIGGKRKNQTCQLAGRAHNNVSVMMNVLLLGDARRCHRRSSWIVYQIPLSCGSNRQGHRVRTRTASHSLTLSPSHEAAGPGAADSQYRGPVGT